MHSKYLNSNTGYQTGETITYNLGTTPYTITNVGSDAINDYIEINNPLPEKAHGFICEWAGGNYQLDLRLNTNSPAKDAGQTVATYEDFSGANRWGTTNDIGAYSDGAGAPRFAVCGDGNIEGNEQCDDGNTANGDGCSSICTIETASICGNNIVEAGETCDDGNTINGDGCSATCQREQQTPIPRLNRCSDDSSSDVGVGSLAIS